MLKTFSNCTVEPVPSTLRKYLVDFRLIVWRFTPLVPGITKYIQRYFWILHSPAHFFFKKLPFDQKHLSSFLLKFKRVCPPPPLLTNQFLTPPRPLFDTIWYFWLILLISQCFILPTFSMLKMLRQFCYDQHLSPASYLKRPHPWE